MFIMLLMKSQDMEKTAGKNNIAYDGFGAFLKKDWKAILVNTLVILVTDLGSGGMIGAASTFFATKTYPIFGLDVPAIYAWEILTAIFYFGTGYFGQDFILRRVVRSVQNTLLKQTMGEKATIIDTQNHTENTPTPMATEIKK